MMQDGGVVQWTGLDGVSALDPQEAPDLAFEALTPAAAPPCAAVDGSHAVLVDNGAWYVVAVRAAAVHRPGDGAPPTTAVHAATADDAAARIEALYTQRGLPVPRIHGADGFAEAHRSLAELDVAVEAVRRLPEGALLLIDGALDGLPEVPQAMAERILDRATASGVHLAGISKRSGIGIDGRPVLPGLAKRPGRWWAPVPGHNARVAKLHPQARHAFRVDAEDSVLPWLADLSRDAVYLGYPYPLAKVHNRVAIPHAEAARLRERLRREMGAAGRVLDDFHAVLDRNAPR